MKKKKILFVFVILVLFGLGIRFGLPVAIKAMGLHPDFVGQRYLLPEGKALIITTSHDRLGEDGDKTGVAASELTVPYYEFKDGRMQVDIASIKGGEIPIDPLTLKFLIRTKHDEQFLTDQVLQEKVKNSRKIDGIDFTEYDIIFLAGGWGAAYDLGTSMVLGEKITAAYKAG